VADAKAELQTLKIVAKNVVAYFYPQDTDTTSQAPELLDILSTRTREVIHYYKFFSFVFLWWIEYLSEWLPLYYRMSS
jgi:hypothetical protein